MAEMTSRMSGPPVFVLCTARSGSTLLRRLLDAHPLLACPPETKLDEPFGSFEFTSQVVAPSESSARAMADNLIREFADRTVGEYARRTGKTRWCEKSLTAVDNLERLARVFPDAQYICLYREPVDMIASGMEASPWGYRDYGFEPYVRHKSTDFVGALATYWADKVEIELQLERAIPERCHRVLYENLVTAPATVLAKLFSFLNLPWDETTLDQDRIFGPRRLDFPGDFKIRYAQDFDVSSIGRGWNIPIESAAQPVRDRVARLSRQLGYPPPPAGMQSTIDALRTRFERLKDRPAVAALMKRRVASVSPLFTERAAPRLVDGSWTSRGVKMGGAVRLVFADIVADGAGEWVIDFSARQIRGVDHPWTSNILTDTETILNIANGTCNPGLALRQGKLQVWADKLSSREALLDRVGAVVSLFVPSPS